MSDSEEITKLYDELMKMFMHRLRMPMWNPDKAPSTTRNPMAFYGIDRDVAEPKLKGLTPNENELKQQIDDIIHITIHDITPNETKESTGTMATNKNRDIDDSEAQVKVLQKGNALVVPDGMDMDTAIKWLQRRKREDEEIVRVSEAIVAHPMDGAFALTKALAQKYGWTNMIPTPGFFGPTPPSMISLEVEAGKTVQVPWGRIAIPNVDGYLVTGWSEKDDQVIFMLHAEVRQKHKKEVAEVAELTRKFLKKGSIYRGQAIRVKFNGGQRDEDGNLKFNPNDTPKFLTQDELQAQELIFADDVNAQIETSLFTPIEKTDLCREHKIPLKRGILLEGQYGTGKTKTAYAAAARCVKNGWTFVYLEKVGELQAALQFAKQYQPCVIFAEDIDRVTDGERDVEMDDILNTIDGIESKDSEIMVVLTTNFVQNIDKAMLRPGRLDAVISVTPPDAKAAEKLMRLYGRSLLRKDADLAEAGAILAGQIPAIIREVVERAKLAALAHSNGKLELDGKDLVLAAKGMLAHLKLLKQEKPRVFSKRELAAQELGHTLGGYLVQVAESRKDGGNGHAKTGLAGVETALLDEAKQ
jgi:transitional endoplasmic reticulum ATPase